MKKALFGCFLPVYLGILIYTAPASLLDTYITQNSQQRLVGSHTSGTLWQGTTRLALKTDEHQFIELSNLSWRFDFSQLLKGQLKAYLTLQGNPESELLLTPNQLTLQKVNITLPAQILGELNPAIKTAQFGGTVQIQSDNIQLGKQIFSGNITLNWKQASSIFSSVNPLGDYQLLLQGQGKNAHVKLSTLSGALILNGEGDCQIGQRCANFTGTAQAAPEQQQALAELLHHLGPEQSPGVRQFRLMK